jgi:hypothetical protein
MIYAAQKRPRSGGTKYDQLLVAEQQEPTAHQQASDERQVGLKFFHDAFPPVFFPAFNDADRKD